MLVASNFYPELMHLKSIEMLFQKSSRTIKQYSEMAVGFPVHNWVLSSHLERGYVQTEPEFNVLLESHIPCDIRCCKAAFFKMYCSTEICEFGMPCVHRIRVFSFRNVVVSLIPAGCPSVRSIMLSVSWIIQSNSSEVW